MARRMGREVMAVSESFGGALRTQCRVRDVLTILAVPLALLATFVLPASIKEQLLFRYEDPTILTAVTAPFVHLDAVHLAMNVAGFLLVVCVVYSFDVLSGNRRRFGVVFATFVVVFPGLLSYLNLAIVRPSVGLGFSGVVMAFVGYLPIAITDYLGSQFDIGSDRSLAPVLFFLGVAFIAVLSVQSILPRNTVVLLGISQLVAATVLAATLFALSLLEGRGELRSAIERLVGAPGYVDLLLIGAVIFVTFPLVAFPPDPTQGEAAVNLYVHLLGFALGFIVVYTTLHVAELVPIDEQVL